MTIRAIIRKLMGIDLEAYIAGLEKAERERHIELENNLASFRATRNVQHDEVLEAISKIKDEWVNANESLDQVSLSLASLKAFFSDASPKINQQYIEVKDQLLLIAGILEKINVTFQERHVNRRQSPPAIKDWEQVQADELAEMLLNPPKEEN